MHGLHHIEQTHLIGIIHRAAAPNGETVAHQIHHVDVAGFGRNAFFQNVRGLIDQRIDQALHDLFVRNLARCDAQCGAMVFNHLDDFGIRNGIAFASDIVIPARTGLLAKAAFFAQQISGLAVLHVGFFKVAALADGPTNIVARQVTHAERAHGKAKFFHRFVNLRRGATLVQQKATLAAILLDHAVANETITHARYHGGLLDLFRQRHHRGQHVLGRFLTAYHFKQLHHIGRAEEVHADHVLRALGERSNFVDIQGGGVGRQDRTRLHHPIKLLEHGLFHANFFKHGFNDHVRVFEVVVAQRGTQQAHALLVFVLFEFAFFDLGFVILANGGNAAVQRLLLHFQHLHRNAGVEEIHRDTAAHRAGTNDRY